MSEKVSKLLAQLERLCTYVLDGPYDPMALDAYLKDMRRQLREIRKESDENQTL